MAAPSTRHIEPLLPAAADVTGAAALTGTGSSTVAGVRLRFGAAALTGTGTSTVAGTRTRFGVAALTGLGSMTVAGTRLRTGAAALTGTGSLTCAGTHAAIGAAALAGNGTLSTNGTRTRFGFATLTGTGTLTCAGTTAKTAAAHLTGTGTLSASGAVSYTGAAHLTGTGTLTVTLETQGLPPPSFLDRFTRRGKQQQPKHVRASAHLTGLGHLEALGMVLRDPGPAVFGGAARLTATLTVRASGIVGATHTGAAVVKFTPTRSLAATVDMSLTGLFATATGSQYASGSADLIGFGSLRAFGFIQDGGLSDRKRDEELLALLL